MRGGATLLGIGLLTAAMLSAVLAAAAVAQETTGQILPRMGEGFGFFVQRVVFRLQTGAEGVSLDHVRDFALRGEEFDIARIVHGLVDGGGQGLAPFDARPAVVGDHFQMAGAADQHLGPLQRRARRCVEAVDAVLADAEVADRVEVLAMDVTDPGSVYDVFQQVDRWEAVAGERGRLIGVVNNAGIRAVGAFEDIPPAVVDRVLETNLYGTLTVSRAAIPRLRTHGGRIVCVTSSSALAGLPAWSAYAASKWGVEGWAESMALETTPHGIDMVLVEPGAYPTDIWRDGTTFGTDDSPYVLMNEAMAEADRQAAERGGDPADVARVVARAFDARSTLIRRPVGRGAWLRWAARGVVPFGVQRWATERMLGLR